MNDTLNIAITNRFFKAISEIIAKKELRGLQTFANLYKIDKRNLYKLKKQPENHTLKPYYLAILVEDFSVSAEWLLTGRGNIFAKKTQLK